MGIPLESFKKATRETPVFDFIPYSHHLTDTILSTRNGDYLSVWHLQGRSHQSVSEDELYQWTQELNNVLRGIATDQVSFWSHVIRRRVQEYPDSTFDAVFCQRLDEKYRSRFAQDTLMKNDLYLTIIFRPNTDNAFSFFSKKEKMDVEQKKQLQEKSLKALEEINQTLGMTLKRYGGELLGIYPKEGRIYSSALEFLGYLLNGEHHPMPVMRSRFAEYMCLNRPFFSPWGEVGELRTLTGSRFFGMLEIADYNDATEPGQLNVLLESKFEFILTQSFSARSRPAAKGFLQRHKQQLVDTQDVAYQQIEELDEALNQLMSGQFVMGEHHATLLVFGDDVEQVRHHLSHARANLMNVALVPKNLDLALEAGFWGQLPANWRYRPRPSPITSLNFLCFSPFHNFMGGKPHGNPWGEAVTLFKTVSETPVYFNFHASNLEEDATDQRLLGNTIMIGKSGTGKTVLLGFLLAQSLKFKPTVVAFDKDRGMEIALRAMGGCYLPLKAGTPSGFNPFQLEPTNANLHFLKDLLKKLASVSGEPVTQRDEEALDQALQTLMFHIDKPLRRLSLLLQSLPNPPSEDLESRPTVHSRLLKWCEGQEYGWLFDNAEDRLDLTTHQLYGFDITDFLDNPETRGPIMMYLIYRTEGMIDGRRFIYLFDEFWKALSDPYFEDLAKNKLKTIRKQNGIFVFATQEPSDALESPIAKTLIQQCATFLFLPNPGADEEDYLQGFKLTETEFERIKNLGEGSRQFLIKQGENSAIAELNLYGFEEELWVLSGTPDRAEQVEKLIREVGKDPAIWLPLFFQHLKEGQIQEETSHV